MPFNITIDHEATRHNSEQSGSSGEESESSDTGVQVSPHSEAHDYSDHGEEQEGSWDVLTFQDELGPSDSASRQQRAHSRQRPPVPPEAPQPEQPSRRRRHPHDRSRNVPPPRGHRQHHHDRSPPSTETESVDPQDDWAGDARSPHGRAYAAQYVAGYPAAQYQIHPSQSIVPVGHQQVVPYGMHQYQVGSPGSISGMSGMSGMNPGYFGHGHPMASPGGGPYGMPGNYFQYPQQNYPMHHPMPPPPPAIYHHSYHPVYSPPPQGQPATSPGPPPPATNPSATESSKEDEKFARIERMLNEQREAQAAKEAAIEKAAKDKAAKDAADAQKAKEIKEASEKAAKEAKEKTEKEHKEAAAKAKEEADKKAEEAKKNKPPAPPPVKQKPIYLKDAVGRKFKFPFHLCNTWQDMDFLIKKAFAHIEGLGPHVEAGHYDLLGPQGEIILPHVWETVVEPDWTITMHMWPMTEENAIPVPEDGLLAEIVHDTKKKGSGSKNKKSSRPLFGAWPSKPPAKGKGKKKAA